MLPKNQNDRISTAVSIASIVVMAATLAFILLVPKPTLKGLKAKFDKARPLQESAAKKAKESQARAIDEIGKYVWTGKDSEVAPAALDKVTRIAFTRHIKVVAFRPQKMIEGNFNQIPFLINLDGSYPDVMRFEKDLEDPANRLAVNLVQLTSADSNSDHVTATVGVLAYLQSSGPEVTVHGS